MASARTRPDSGSSERQLRVSSRPLRAPERTRSGGPWRRPAMRRWRRTSSVGARVRPVSPELRAQGGGAGLKLQSHGWRGSPLEEAAAAWVTRPLRPFGPPLPEGEDLFCGRRWRACPGLGLDPRLRGDGRWRVGGRPQAGAGLVSEAWVAGLRRRGAAAAWVEAASGPSGHLPQRGRSCLAAGRAVRTAPRATAEPAGGAGRRTR